MLKEYLEITYGCNEPIFINEVRIDNMNDNTLRQSFKRMVKSGELVRFDTGIYYLPRTSRLLNKSYLDPMKVITRKYIRNEDDTYGYFSGATLANQIGLTTQMPSVIEIITDKEATKGRIVTIGPLSVRLKRPPVKITKDNANILQFLDAVSQTDKYSELPKEEAEARLKSYAGKQCFTKAQLSGVMPAVTGQTAKRLIEWGIIYEFAS